MAIGGFISFTGTNPYDSYGRAVLFKTAKNRTFAGAYYYGQSSYPYYQYTNLYDPNVWIQSA